MKQAERFPLWAQVVVSVALGIATGAWLGDDVVAFGLGTEHLGRLGMLVIRALKGLAVPLVLFSILDALLRYSIAPQAGRKLIRICLVNVAVALLLGLTLVNVFQPGFYLRDLFAPMMDAAPPAATAGAVDPIAGIESAIPKSIVGPLAENSVLGAVLLALLAGAALRRMRNLRGKDDAGIAAIQSAVTLAFEALQLALGWVIKAVPLAAFGLVAQAVGSAGLYSLFGLWAFFAVIAAGLLIHAFVYYPFMAWAVGGRSPRAYLGAARDAIVTGLASNSSLTTVPVTLRCLDEGLGVSPESSRLAACIGSNLNNDGITLYEAMAVLVIAQACGFHLGFGQQAAVVAASLMAGIGIAGIPEAGLVMLPMVLATAGLPETVVAAAIPLVLPVDWILARLRTVVNVLSDMLVAVLLDTGVLPSPAAAAADEHGTLRRASSTNHE